jgi:cytochrome oxidase Cu insertion factor (SCO1/SenC/PrrC family)
MRRVAFILILLPLVGCSAPPPVPDDLGLVPNFALTERSGRSIQRDDLLGKTWIVSFVFTRCTGPCPQISGTMARLQSEFADTPDVVLVTITADPERDDPDELKRYAEHFGADPERWLFLTGPSKAIRDLAVDGFHVALGKEGDEIMHSTKLVLVDQHSHIRGYFDGRSVDELGQPVDEVPKLRFALDQLRREQP